uniref:Uncharacterized protein n=1 Tax=Avena sativa TaxID=4498 RepID=A0ACD5ZWN3_AVESA
MEEGAPAALRVIRSSIDALGRGFDANHDTRLLYCKGSRLVEVDDDELTSRDLVVSDGLTVTGVPKGVDCLAESGTGGTETAGPCSFHEMAGHFNKKSQLAGNLPLGSFNLAYSFTGSKKFDAMASKSLGMEGKTVSLYKVQLVRQHLSLVEEVKYAVPHSWEPSSLARFIQNYGTHVITSITIGGKDVIYIKQHMSSSLSAVEIKSYIHDLGYQRFSENETPTGSGPIRPANKETETLGFNSQGVYPQPPSTPYIAAKEDVTVIFRRRGGDDLVQSHTEWARTVNSAPDVIQMTFVPITTLLEAAIPGKDHLIRAINLYLEYKPPIEELRYFLEFQLPKVWAPVHDEHPGYQRKEPVCPSLQFSMMGKKLYISQEQVSVGRKPITGLRLCLEGAKQNRLCIQLQHLASLPKILKPYWDAHITIGALKWQGPEEQDSRWFEAVKWKNFSHVSTAPVEHHETLFGDASGVYIVTGAQLGVWDFGSKNVLYMKLLYSRVPGCTTRRSLWDHSPAAMSNHPDSGDSGAGSSDAGKFVKIVDRSELCKGPDDMPGHWLVTGGKLGVEKGRIVLRVKYSLLNY